jgi:hypothetical protein
MYLDALMNFGLPGITNSTTKTVSPSVLDAQSAKVMFGAAAGCCKVVWKTVITADAAPTILIEMWAGDAADGDVNDNETSTNDILGSSGIVRTHRDGTPLATGDTVVGSFPIQVQKRARRYYGLNTTLGGTNPDIVAATSFAYVVRDAQTNLVEEPAA